MPNRRYFARTSIIVQLFNKAMTGSLYWPFHVTKS